MVKNKHFFLREEINRLVKRIIKYSNFIRNDQSQSIISHTSELSIITVVTIITLRKSRENHHRDIYGDGNNLKIK